MSMGDVLGQAVVERVIPQPVHDPDPNQLDLTGMKVEYKKELAKQRARQENMGDFTLLKGWSIPCVLGGIVGGYFLTKYFEKK